MIKSGEFISLITVNVAVVGAILGVGWKVFQAIKQVSDTGEKKRGRIYDKLDEDREIFKSDFVNREVCELKHTQLSSDIAEIKGDVKTILRNGSSNK